MPAAEALGMIGHKPAAPAIAAMVSKYVGALDGITPDDMAHPKPPAVEAVRLGVYALVRLGSYDALAGAVLDNGRPRSRWWPIAYALQRINKAQDTATLVVFDGDHEIVYNPGLAFLASLPPRG